MINLLDLHTNQSTNGTVLLKSSLFLITSASYETQCREVISREEGSRSQAQKTLIQMRSTLRQHLPYYTVTVLHSCSITVLISYSHCPVTKLCYTYSVIVHCSYTVTVACYYRLYYTLDCYILFLSAFLPVTHTGNYVTVLCYNTQQYCYKSILCYCTEFCYNTLLKHCYCTLVL